MVKDVDQAASNWAALLGMEKPEPGYFPAADRVPNFTNGEPTDIGDVLAVVFDLPNVRIELVQPGSNPNAFTAKMARDGEGLQHISFIVPDRHAANQALQELGAPQPYHIGYWPDGTYAFVDSTEQLGVEINIKTDDSNAEKIQEIKRNPALHRDDLV